MDEIIKKIQILVENSNAAESKKKMWQTALRGLSKVNFPEEYKIETVLESVRLDAEKDINALDIFFQKIGSFVYAYVKGGDKTLGETIDESIAELDEKLKEFE
ncbi:MAG: hypothetical protein WCW66_05375 [Patescibacteria group bacterium]|jgi:hypothetical protein